MGLIKALAGAVGGTLADQWKEFFYCDAIDADTLVVKGQKRITSRSSNTKGNDNIISNGSGIAVADGQCMIIVDQGKVVEFCAEPGQFTYDNSSEPSIFAGKLGKSIIDTFKTIGRRIAYGGDTGKDQRVYYFNLKEITDNKFGTAAPVPFKVVINEQLGFKLSVDLKCNGVYSYKLVDPILFYTNVCGNVTESYKRDKIDGMLKGELIQALQPALAVLSANGVSYDQIPAHTVEVRDALNEVLKEQWGRRGIEIFSMNMGVPSIPEDQRKKITEWEETSMTLNPTVAAGRMTGGVISAMNTAAANEGGAMNGFIGMGMAMNQGAANIPSLFAAGENGGAAGANAPQAPQGPQGGAPADNWVCPVCGVTVNGGKFCPECGAPRPQAKAEGWTCEVCGSVNKGNFCTECGAKRPADAPLYRCDKCGWEPEDPKNPPRFCPQCGDRFDENDKV
ncbi:MAG: SPFH domain-containing protein [Clostridia bacterium]|nr:SPFH domain-containing protein [Clostridia bacterium]MBQ3867740.1 SPFH domain-containing protein [Clostridia bacterium]